MLQLLDYTQQHFAFCSRDQSDEAGLLHSQDSWNIITWILIMLAEQTRWRIKILLKIYVLSSPAIWLCVCVSVVSYTLEYICGMFRLQKGSWVVCETRWLVHVGAHVQRQHHNASVSVPGRLLAWTVGQSAHCLMLSLTSQCQCFSPWTPTGLDYWSVGSLSDA